MNIHTIIKLVLVYILMFYMSGTSLAASKKVAFVLINDDSGVMTDMEKIPDLRNLLLAQYKDLKKQSRHYAKAEFVVISTALARPVWYGKISDLSTARGGEVIERSANNPKHCNQLANSFIAARNSIVQLASQGVTEIHVSVFSSMISTPIPCETVSITLPQLPVPVNWAANLTPTSQVRSVTFYAVNTYQYPVYSESVEPLAKWAVDTGNEFSIHNVEESIHVLRFGLKGAQR